MHLFQMKFKNSIFYFQIYKGINTLNLTKAMVLTKYNGNKESDSSSYYDVIIVTISNPIKKCFISQLKSLWIICPIHYHPHSNILF